MKALWFSPQHTDKRSSAIFLLECTLRKIFKLGKSCQTLFLKRAREFVSRCYKCSCGIVKRPFNKLTAWQLGLLLLSRSFTFFLKCRRKLSWIFHKNFWRFSCLTFIDHLHGLYSIIWNRVCGKFLINLKWIVGIFLN